MKIFSYIWIGFWQGIGVELSFALLYVLWLFFYHRQGHKFDAKHFVHKVHDYITN